MLTTLRFEHYKRADLLRSLVGSHCRRFCERQGKYDKRQYKQLEAEHLFHRVNREFLHLLSPLPFVNGNGRRYCRRRNRPHDYPQTAEDNSLACDPEAFRPGNLRRRIQMERKGA